MEKDTAIMTGLQKLDTEDSTVETRDKRPKTVDWKLITRDCGLKPLNVKEGSDLLNST